MRELLTEFESRGSLPDYFENFHQTHPQSCCVDTLRKTSNTAFPSLLYMFLKLFHEESVACHLLKLEVDGRVSMRIFIFEVKVWWGYKYTHMGRTDSLLLACLLATGHTICIACKFDCERTSEPALFFKLPRLRELLFMLPGPAGSWGQKDAWVLAEGQDLPVAIRLSFQNLL